MPLVWTVDHDMSLRSDCSFANSSSASGRVDSMHVCFQILSGNAQHLTMSESLFLRVYSPDRYVLNETTLPPVARGRYLLISMLSVGPLVRLHGCRHARSEGAFECKQKVCRRTPAIARLAAISIFRPILGSRSGVFPPPFLKHNLL